MDKIKQIYETQRNVRMDKTKQIDETQRNVRMDKTKQIDETNETYGWIKQNKFFQKLN